MSLQRHTIQRDGVDLAWYDTGGAGMLVVYQHGLCGDVRQTTEAFPAGYRLITLECRGHGASQAGDPGQFSIATFADDVVALIEHLALGPLVVGGISMGAAIATRLAVTRPELVRALALVRPAWIATSAPSNMQPNAEVGALLSRLSPDAARPIFLASPTHDHLAADAPDNLASLLSFFEREPIAITAALLQAIAADGPNIAEANLGHVSIPTLIIGTEQDAIHPWTMAEQLAALIPGARLHRATPKAIDKSRYLADLHATLGAFFEDI